MSLSLFVRLFCNLSNDRAVGTPIFFRQILFRIKNMADRNQKYYIVSSLRIFVVVYKRSLKMLLESAIQKSAIRKNLKNLHSAD